MKTHIVILGSRLLAAINSMAWAKHHLAPNPNHRKAPDGPVMDRKQVQALVDRFGISAKVYAKAGLWSDLGDVIAATPRLREAEIDLSALLGRMARETSEPELHLGGFVRFLGALACGEMTEADLTAGLRA